MRKLQKLAKTQLPASTFLLLHHDDWDRFKIDTNSGLRGWGGVSVFILCKHIRWLITAPTYRIWQNWWCSKSGVGCTKTGSFHLSHLEPRLSSRSLIHSSIPCRLQPIDSLCCYPAYCIFRFWFPCDSFFYTFHICLEIPHLSPIVSTFSYRFFNAFVIVILKSYTAVSYIWVFFYWPIMFLTWVMLTYFNT